MSTETFSIVVVGIIGLLLAVPVSLVVRTWISPSTRRKTSGNELYCNGVAISLEDFDTRR